MRAAAALGASCRHLGRHTRATCQRVRRIPRDLIATPRMPQRTQRRRAPESAPARKQTNTTRHRRAPRHATDRRTHAAARRGRECALERIEDGVGVLLGQQREERRQLIDRHGRGRRSTRAKTCAADRLTCLPGPAGHAGGTQAHATEWQHEVHGRAGVHAGARQSACALWMGSMRQNVAKQGRVSTKSGVRLSRN